MTRRPWNVGVGSLREQTFETELSAMGYATVATISAPIGTNTLVRNSESKITWSVTHLEGFRLDVRRHGGADGG